MNRRVFLKVTGLAAVAGTAVALPRAAGWRPEAVGSVPSGGRLAIHEPGTYRISGRVRLDAPLVEISGISHSQRITWSGFEGPERPVASFSTFERFDRPGMTPTIHVHGGHLESVTAVLVDFA
jgi:hypothetical protein